MGKVTRLRQEQNLEKSQKLVHYLKHRKAESTPDIAPGISPEIRLYNKYVIAGKSINEFSSKLKTEDPVKRQLEQIRYFFGKYPVNAAMESIWTDQSFFNRGRKNSFLNPLTNQYEDFTLWYICVASGGSLYKQYAKSFLTKKEVHNLITCPLKLSFAPALIFSIAKSAGGSPGICSTLFNSKLSQSASFGLNPFWQSVIRFFVINPPKSVQELNDLIDYLSHLYANPKVITNSSGNRVTHLFSMAGQHLSTLRIKMEEWHRELARAKVLGNDSWTGLAAPNSVLIQPLQENEEIHWDVKQICSSKELAKEGTAMRHCVLSYKQKCVAGDCSIWSFSTKRYFKDSQVYADSIRKFTVEVNNHSMAIVQARGLANRQLRPEEKNILYKWAAQLGLSYSRYY